LDRSTLAAVFDTAQGKSGVGTAEDAVGRVVFRVTAVTAPPATEAASQRVAELATGIQDDILVQYVLHLQQQLGVSVNQTVLRTVTGGGDTGN
jgi:hypothetical protein